MSADERWIARSEALTRLGVKAQTLYAYVSRGRIAARPDPTDPRRSLYAVSDVARIELGAQTYSMEGRLNGKPAALIALYQIPGANALEAANGAKALMEKHGVPVTPGYHGEDQSVKTLKAAAKKIAGQSRPIAMMTKETVNAAYETTLRQGIMLERRLFHSMFATHDQKEGMAAFVEKRPAKFSNT